MTEVRVSVRNTSDFGGLAITNPWFGFHDGSYELFEVADPASDRLAFFASTLASDRLLSITGETPSQHLQRTLAAEPVGQQFGFSQFQSGSGSLGVYDDISLAPQEIQRSIFDIDSAQNPYVSFISVILPSDDAFIGTDDAFRLFDDSGNFLGVQSFHFAGTSILDAGVKENGETHGPGFTNEPYFSLLETSTVGGVIQQHPGYNGSLANPEATPANALDGINFLSHVIDPLAADFTIPGAQIAEFHFNLVKTMSGDGLDNDLFGGTEDDIIYGGGGNDSLNGATGWDDLYGGDGSDTLDGNAGDDHLFGEAGNDTAFGNDGSDIVYGGAGNDSLDGGSGRDLVYGGESNDTISGGVGSDLLFGDAGDDSILGGLGDDTINGGAGVDSLDGQSGIDTLDLSDEALGGTINLAQGLATLGALAAVETILNFENAIGTQTNDSLTGTPFDNHLDGGGGTNTLFGLAGNDTLLNGDVIYGGDDDDWVRVPGQGWFSEELVFDGGSGTDTLDLTETSNLIIDLSQETGYQTQGPGPTPTVITGFENVLGSDSGTFELIIGNSHSNRIDGRNGSNRLFGLDGDDHLISGNNSAAFLQDFLYGGFDNDIYEISGFSGTDWIGIDEGGLDTLYFTNAVYKDLEFRIKANSGTSGFGEEMLEIKWLDSAGGENIVNLGDRGLSIDRMVFADGSERLLYAGILDREIDNEPPLMPFASPPDGIVADPGNGQPSLFGTPASDDLSGAGNLHGLDGDDVYRIGSDGVENYIFYETAGVDTVLFEDLRIRDFSFDIFEHPSDLIDQSLEFSWDLDRKFVRVAERGTVIERFAFADSSEVAGVSVSAANGSVTLTALASGSKVHAGGNVFQIYGRDGADDLSGAGNLYGFGGDDTYRIGRDGIENVIAYEVSGDDIVIFENLALDEVNLASMRHAWDTIGDALVFSWNDFGDTALVTEELLVANLGRDIEQFSFANGSEVANVSFVTNTTGATLTALASGSKVHANGSVFQIYGQTGDDDLSGAQNLYGFEGNDTYRIGKDGDEKYIVYETAGIDTVVFEDLDLVEVSFSIEEHPWGAIGDALYAEWLAADGTPQDLHIADRGTGIERFSFADGSDVADISVSESSGSVTLTAFANGSKIHAGGNAFQIFGRGGADDLSGANNLYGFGGDDIYRITRDGTERVIAYETAGIDTVVFEDLTLDDIALDTTQHPWAAIGNALAISWTTSEGAVSSLLIADRAGDVEFFEFSDGETYSQQEFLALL